MNGNTSQEPRLVLGGTGKTGRRVVERLTARGLPVRIGSRSGQRRLRLFSSAAPTSTPTDNKRVAAARLMRTESIDADVIRLETGYELAADVDLRQLIHTQQHPLFMEQAGLELVRPGATIESSGRRDTGSCWRS
jgi:uncharacterized protein YbjT (DUF2867 family)